MPVPTPALTADRHHVAGLPRRQLCAGCSTESAVHTGRAAIESDMPKRGRALVYSGPGAGDRSVLSAIEALKDSLPAVILVEQLTPERLLESDWRENCAVLVMPGGADLPYCKTLNGKGNKLIREYVERGGSYLGLCAGAYYAAAHVEFELGTKLEVRGPRELRFFPGTASGGAYPGFQYMSEAGAAAAPLVSRSNQESSDAVSDMAATRACHLTDLAEGATSTGSNINDTERFYDYSNGGPRFDLEAMPSAELSDYKVLAQYADFGGATAALACRVGAGHAVLSGTHPELDPHWLGMTDRAIEPTDGSQGPGRDNAMTVRKRLEQTQSLRRRFWLRLLEECGLQDLKE